MSISVNVLGQTVSDRTALTDWFTKSRPDWAVVMDEYDIANRVLMASPNTRLIFRRYRPDDHKLHETVSPLGFLESVADVPKAWWVAAGNEPGGDQVQMSEWYAALIRLADQRGRKLAIWNVSTGNPDSEMVEDGVYDAMFRAIATSTGGHALCHHEYFGFDPLREPFHIGRLKMVLARFDVLGIKRPTVVVTESGRDLAGGADGWRTVYTEAEYADKMADVMSVYDPLGITACVFCWGHGNGRWATYNVEGARELLARMSAMNSGDDEMAGPPGWVQVKTGPSGVNVRSAPGLSYAPIAVVKTGDWAKPSGPTTKANGYTWQKISLEDCRTGYVATEVIELGD